MNRQILFDVEILEDSRFKGCTGHVVGINYITVDGVKTPIKYQVIVDGDDVFKSGFTDYYIEKKNLTKEGVYLLKDPCNVRRL